MIGFADGLIAT